MAVKLFFIILQKCVNVRAVQQRVEFLQVITMVTYSWFYPEKLFQNKLAAKSAEFLCHNL